MLRGLQEYLLLLHLNQDQLQQELQLPHLHQLQLLLLGEKGLLQLLQQQ
uniref:Uncharacterized protein n=1 Tax=Triticum urartu TaxID=4572 RepID=A0A8R7UX60_TRIUA